MWRDFTGGRFDFNCQWAAVPNSQNISDPTDAIRRLISAEYTSPRIINAHAVMYKDKSANAT